MKGTHIGEYEEIILLLVGILGEEAYGLLLMDKFIEQAKRSTTIGAVHAALSRLEEKGFLTSELGGATKERGGRRKRIFSLTASGKSVLEFSRDIRVGLWEQFVINSI
jgi:PadR family transcriptional regulator PadR